MGQRQGKWWCCCRSRRGGSAEAGLQGWEADYVKLQEAEDAAKARMQLVNRWIWNTRMLAAFLFLIATAAFVFAWKLHMGQQAFMVIAVVLVVAEMGLWTAIVAGRKSHHRAVQQCEELSAQRKAKCAELKTLQGPFEKVVELMRKYAPHMLQDMKSEETKQLEREKKQLVGLLNVMWATQLHMCDACRHGFVQSMTPLHNVMQPYLTPLPSRAAVAAASASGLRSCKFDEVLMRTMGIAPTSGGASGAASTPQTAAAAPAVAGRVPATPGRPEPLQPAAIASPDPQASVRAGIPPRTPALIARQSSRDAGDATTDKTTNSKTSATDTKTNNADAHEEEDAGADADAAASHVQKQRTASTGTSTNTGASQASQQSYTSSGKATALSEIDAPMNSTTQEPPAEDPNPESAEDAEVEQFEDSSDTVARQSGLRLRGNRK